MKSISPDSPQNTLQTVDRALTFLEIVASAEKPLTVKDVAAALQVNLTTTYHLLRTLMAHGYIERHDDLTLSLGRGLGILLRAYQRNFDVDERLGRVVDELARQTSETAFLSVRDGDTVNLRVLVEGTQPLRVSGLFVGMTGNEHHRASGKAVLACLPRAERDSMLAAALAGLSGAERATELAKLQPELAATEKRGWSLDHQESDVGISSVGAPVFGPGGEVYGAVGVVTPTLRMDRSQDRYVEMVKSAAAEMTEFLRHAPIR